MKYSHEIEQVLRTGEGELASFESITEAEIISLWEAFKSFGLSQEQAWNAILAGIALDLAFARTKNLAQLEQ